MKTKSIEIEGLRHPMHFRPGTSDETIISVMFGPRPEYAFPSMSQINTVLDIGANIGVISVILAHVYPHAIIHAFEPVKSNFEILKMNTEKYPNIRRHQIALGWRDSICTIFESLDDTNFGGFSFHKEGSKDRGEIVKVREVNAVFRELGLTAVDLIKTDCEGAEFDILSALEPAILKKVRWMAGELHGVNDFKLLDLLSKDFDLALKKDFDQRTWHFLAKNIGSIDHP